jgi:hypothetical protein
MRDHRADEEQGIGDAYKVGVKITLSRESVRGGKAMEVRYS